MSGAELQQELFAYYSCRCNTFVIFEGAGTLVLVSSKNFILISKTRADPQFLNYWQYVNVGFPPINNGDMLLKQGSLVIMIIRIYALYGRSNIVLGFLMTLWVGQITVTSIGLTTGFRTLFS